jgi:hypothetical protein
LARRVVNARPRRIGGLWLRGRTRNGGNQ